MGSPPLTGPPAPTAPGSHGIGTILGIGGIGLQLAGGFQGARAAIEQANAERSAAEFNAQLAENEGREEASRLRKGARRELSRQHVRFLAKSGVTESGSVLEVRASNAAEFEREASNVELSARNTARLNRSRGAVARRRGKRQARASVLQGATGALGTAFKIFR